MAEIRSWEVCVLLFLLHSSLSSLQYKLFGCFVPDMESFVSRRTEGKYS